MMWLNICALSQTLFEKWRVIRKYRVLRLAGFGGFDLKRLNLGWGLIQVISDYSIIEQ